MIHEFQMYFNTSVQIRFLKSEHFRWFDINPLIAIKFELIKRQVKLLTNEI